MSIVKKPLCPFLCLSLDVGRLGLIPRYNNGVHKWIIRLAIYFSYLLQKAYSLSDNSSLDCALLAFCSSSLKPHRALGVNK